MFAWGAIFNKISWKHFANIAIGLFLVANMGQLIEYVVSNGDEGYYLGQWESSTAKKDDSNRMSHAFSDTYRVYGYELMDPPFNETPTSPAEPTPKKSSENEVATETSVVQDEMQKRGYCQGTGSIWSSIKSCVGDIVGSINKAANVVKTTVSTVNHVKNRAADVAQSAKSIANAFGTIKNGDVMSGLGAVLNNIDHIGQNIGSAKGAVGTGSKTIIENI